MHRVLLAVDASEASEAAARLLAHFPHDDRIDLLVLGEASRNLLTRFLLGSTSR